MKRIGNLFHQITDIGNLRLAAANAQKGKAHQPGVIAHNLRAEEDLLGLQNSLLTGTYRTSPYTRFTIYEPKEREIFRLPFIDRICHHAILNILKPIFVSHFTADTYSCIDGKGIHGAHRAIRSALSDGPGTRYCLKLDIRKFYPSVNHDTLKHLLRRKFKDAQLLWLLDEIIDSTEGLPIGNYLSQYFANFYLSGFDHWLKEEKRVRYYFRYADDIVLLAPGKPELHALLAEIRAYLGERLQLEVKDNHQIFPVAARGIDFVGYVSRHTHTRLRKTIKQRFARMAARHRNPASIAAYNGWAVHCDSKNLVKKLLV